MKGNNCYIGFYGVDANDWLFEQALHKMEEENESMSNQNNINNE